MTGHPSLVEFSLDVVEMLRSLVQFFVVSIS